MAISLSVSAVDYHTGGEPFRIVSGGVPLLEGRTILEKRRFALERLDHLRRLLVNEPRGHADMYGGFVTEPEDEDADLGVGALESGLIERREPETRVVVDVPSGRLETVARVGDGRVRSVRFRNVPAYVEAEGLRVQTSRGELAADVAFGGAFYACVEPRAARLAVEPARLPALIELGRELKRLLEVSREFVHPLEPELRDIYGVVFHEDEEEGPPLVQRNVTVFADGEVDRSPCGSATSGRLALLERAGRLPRGETLRHRSVVGSEFTARVVGDAEVAGRPAVVTEVEGSAHLTGYHQFVLEADDELGTGFLLR